MGQIFFEAPESLRPHVPLWDTAYLYGIEGIPGAGKASWESDLLTIEREIQESGKLSIPWTVDQIGQRVLTSCSLRPSETPYFLPLELARGCCSNVRTQADIWQRSGMKLPENYEELINQSISRFLDAAQSMPSHDDCVRLSNESIRLAEQASDALVDSYAAQALSYRKNAENELGTLSAAYVAPPGPIDSANEQAYLDAFNTIAIRTNWTTLETDMGKMEFDRFDPMFDWAQNKGLRVCAGPLIDFQSKQMPHWVYLFEDDFEGLLDAVTRMVEQTVKRYRGKVQLWHATAGLNTKGPLELGEEKVMRLAVGVIQEIRRHDNRTPILISVDQPWGEYLSTQPDGISPLHFVDALVRSNLGIAGIGLELRMNYWPGGTLPRSILEVSQQVDRWALLGLPLLAQISIPASAESDASAARTSIPVPIGINGESDQSHQLAYAARLTRALLAKQMVHGIFWESWEDTQTHAMPAAGLIDATGRPRPLLEELANLRKEYLF